MDIFAIIASMIVLLLRGEGAMILFSFPLPGTQICSDTISYMSSTVVLTSAYTPMNAKLQNDLLSNGMRRTVLPNNGTGPVNVSVYVTIEKINELDDVKEELHWSGYVTVQWTNPFLRWNPNEYGDTYVIFLQEDDMWTPDICIYERLDAQIGFKEQKRRLIRVYHTGEIEWTLGGDIIVTRCSLQVHKFPFDRQSCSFRLGSYVMDRRQIELIDADGGTYDADGGNNTLWDVTGWNSTIVNAGYATGGTGGALVFQTMKFTIYLQRRSGYFVMLILAPSMIMSSLIGMVFLMPIECGEKLGFSITLLLAINVLQLVTNDHMPKTSETTPIINIYVTSQGLLCALAIPLTILVNTIYYHGCQKFPFRLRKIFSKMAALGCVGYRGCHYRMKTGIEAQEQNNGTQNENWKDDTITETPVANEETDWQEVARQLDSFLFKLFYIIIIFITIGCAIAYTMPE